MYFIWKNRGNSDDNLGKKKKKKKKKNVSSNTHITCKSAMYCVLPRTSPCGGRGGGAPPAGGTTGAGPTGGDETPGGEEGQGTGRYRTVQGLGRLLILHFVCDSSPIGMIVLSVPTFTVLRPALMCTQTLTQTQTQNKTYIS